MISKLEKIGLYKNAGIFLSIQTIWTNYTRQYVYFQPFASSRLFCWCRSFKLEIQLTSTKLIPQDSQLKKSYSTDLTFCQSNSKLVFIFCYFTYSSNGNCIYILISSYMLIKKPSILIHSDFYYICMYILNSVILHFIFNLTSLTVKHFDLSKPQHVPLFQISLRTVE